MSTRTSWLIAAALIGLTFLGSALVYGRLPEQIPIHWNIQGQADKFGPKVWAVWLMPCGMLLMALIFAALPWLSPKQFEIERFRSTYQFIVVLVLALFAFIHALTLIGALNERFDLNRVVLAGMMLFFAVIGNVMGKVQRNFYVGIRLPWTLASDRVWNDTHRLAAWLWTAAGIIGFALVWLPGPWMFSGFALLAVAVIVPAVYSLVHYKQLERRGEV